MMTRKDVLAGAILFGWIGVVYSVYGLEAVGITGLGMSVMRVVLGVGTGYWIGNGADDYVIELMKYLKKNGSIR